MVKYCTVDRCSSSSYNKERRFYTFPSDEHRFEIWIQATGRDDLRAKNAETLRKYYYICDLHFRESDRYNKRLKCNAVPILNISSSSSNHPVSTSTQTETDASFMRDFSCQANIDEIYAQTTQIEFVSTNTLRKHKLKEDLSQIREKKEKIENETEKLHILQSEIKMKEEIIEIETREMQSLQPEPIIEKEKNYNEKLLLLQTETRVKIERIENETETTVKEEKI